MEHFLFERLIENGPSVRGDLVKLTNSKRTTIYDHLVKLMLEDKVVSYSIPKGERGRPNVFFEAIQKK